MAWWKTNHTVSVTIDGVDVTSALQARSLYARQNIGNSADVASFELRDADGDINPGGWDEVTIAIDGTNVFGGYIVSHEDHATDGIDGVTHYDIECKDYSILLDTVTVNERYGTYESGGLIYGYSDADIIDDLFTTYLGGEGFDTSTHVTSQGALEIAFEDVTLRDALNQLAAQMQADWFIAPDQSLYWFNPASPGNASFSIDTQSPDYSSSYPPLRASLQRSIDDIGIVNKVIVLGGFNDTRTDETFTYVSGENTYTLANTPKSIVQVKATTTGAGPIPATPGSRRLGYSPEDSLVDDGGEAYYLVDLKTGTVKIDSTVTGYMSAGDTIDVDYVYREQVTTTRENTASQATFGRTFERRIYNESLSTVAQAENYGDEVLDQYAWGRESIRFDVAEHGLLAGRLLTVDAPEVQVGAVEKLGLEQGGAVLLENGDAILLESSSSSQTYVIQQVEIRTILTDASEYLVVASVQAGAYQNTLIEALSRLGQSSGALSGGIGPAPALRNPGSLSRLANDLGEIVAGRGTFTDGGTAPLSWSDFAGHTGVVIGLDDSGDTARGNFLLLDSGTVQAKIGRLNDLGTIAGMVPTGWGLFTQNGYFYGTINAVAGSFSGTVTAVAGTFSGTVTASVITASEMTGGTISAAKFSGGTVVGGFISGGTVSGGFITGGTVQGGYVTGGTVNGALVTGGTVQSSLFTGGTVDVTAGSIGGWTLASGTIYSGSVYLDANQKAIYAGNAISAKGAGFAAGSTSFADVAWWVGATLAGRGTAPVRAYYGGSIVARAGQIGGLTVDGNLLYTDNGTVQTGSVVNSSNPGVRMEPAGLFGYGTLGLTFALYSDPAKSPWVSSGTINNVVYEVYESGVLRTSADPFADGGVQIDNSGIFGISPATGAGFLGLENGDALLTEDGVAIELEQSGLKFMVDTATGRVSMEEAWVSGTVFADAGQFSGTVFASAGSFSGTVNASAGAFTGTVTAATITASEMSGGTVSGGVISGGTVTGAVFTGGTVSGGTINAAKFSGGTVSGALVTGGTVQAGNGTVTLDDDGLRLNVGSGANGANAIDWQTGGTAFQRITAYNIGQQRLDLLAYTNGASDAVIIISADELAQVRSRIKLDSGSKTISLWSDFTSGAGTTIIYGDAKVSSGTLAIGSYLQFGTTNYGFNSAGVGTAFRLYVDDISYFTGNATFYGNVVLGNSSTDEIQVNGKIDSHLLPKGTTHSVGDGPNRWSSVWANGGYFWGDVDLGNASSHRITVIGLIDSDLVPDSSGARALGDSSHAWGLLYLERGGTVFTVDVNSSGDGLTVSPA